jgi:hypothetical protein
MTTASTTVDVTVADPPAGAPPDPAQSEPVTQTVSDQPPDDAAELDQLNKDLAGVVKQHHREMIAEAKGDAPPAPAADEEPHPASANESKPDEEPQPTDEPAPTLSKARRRMARARQKEAAAEQLMGKIQGQAELLEQQLAQVSAATKLFAQDPIAGFDAMIRAAGADEDKVFAALAERRLSEGTPAERAKAKPPAAADEPAWAAELRKEIAELKHGREADQAAATQAAVQAELKQAAGACFTALTTKPEETPYLAAEPPEDQRAIITSMLTELQNAKAELTKNPSNTELLWIRQFTENEVDKDGKVLRTGVQKFLGALDRLAKERYTHRHERIKQLLPGAPADASGSQGATSAGESSPAAPGAKGERKLGGANVAANASARGRMTDEEEAAALDRYLRGETDKLPGK